MIKNSEALTAAGGTPPSGPRIALGVSRDLEFHSSDGGSQHESLQELSKAPLSRGISRRTESEGRIDGSMPFLPEDESSGEARSRQAARQRPDERKSERSSKGCGEAREDREARPLSKLLQRHPSASAGCSSQELFEASGSDMVMPVLSRGRAFLTEAGPLVAAPGPSDSLQLAGHRSSRPANLPRSLPAFSSTVALLKAIDIAEALTDRIGMLLLSLFLVALGVLLMAAPWAWLFFDFD